MSKQFAEFRVGDLFEEGIKRGDISSQGYLIEDPNGVSFVAQNDNNNGFVKKVAQRECKVFNSGSICIGRQTGVVYYQPYDFVTTDGVLVVDIGKSRRIGMYIVASLGKALSGSGYSNTVSAKSLKDTHITLPVTDESAGTESPEPDWEYMETYIKEIEAKYLDSVVKYNKRNGEILDTLYPDYHGSAPEAYDYAEFRVGDVFEITPTKWYKDKPIVESDVIVPQVSNTTQPNGVTSFEKYPANNDGNVITFSDTTVGGETLFYQPVDFIGYSHVQKMVPLNFELNQNIAHYVISAFRKAVVGKFNYAAKFNRENASNTYITLPTTPTGEPDWVFMEDYIDYIAGGGETESRATCSTRRAHPQTVSIKDVNLPEPEFAEFRVGDVFEVKNIQMFNKHEVIHEGNTPYITRSAKDNGISGYADNPNSRKMNRGNVITFGAESVKFYYQKVPFVAGNKMYYVMHEKLNKRIAMYLISVFEKKTQKTFGYSNGLTGTKFSELSFTFPITPTGEPDWGYMESYIRKIEKQERERIARYVQHKKSTSSSS